MTGNLTGKVSSKAIVKRNDKTKQVYTEYSDW